MTTLACHFEKQNPCELLHARLTTANAEQPLLVFEDECLDYSAVYQRVMLLLKHFSDYPIHTGQRVVVALEADENTALVLLALALIGAVTTPFDTEASDVDQQHMLAVIQPDIVIFSEQQQQHWHQSQSLLDVSSTQLITEAVISDLAMTAAGDDLSTITQPSCASLTMDSPMMILYTSGTTAKPKGVQLSYQAVLEQSQDMVNHLRINSSSGILNLFRFYQIGSLVNGLYLALLAGATLYRPYRQLQLNQALPLLEMMQQQAISHFVLVPTLLAQLIKFPTELKQACVGSKFMALVSTAAHLPPTLWQEFETLTGKPIVNIYGLTEANDITATPLSLKAGRIGTIGQPLNCQIKILDADGQLVDNQQQGHLWVCGKTQMDGYFNAPALTETVIKQGWFDTGDLAKFNEQGHLVYLGRASERIISGGHTIHPEEVRELLLKHPDIHQAYVFGEPHSDWQELVSACVIKKREDLSKPDIVAFLRERLAPYKIPRRLYFVDEIPVSDRGKVRRDDVLNMVAVFN